jgi:hydroxyethylthiazole kinase-like uncharacterized protein yjeF
MINHDAPVFGIELLDPSEMKLADRAAAMDLYGGSYELMQRAGAAVLGHALSFFPYFGEADILCGPGNNGGDGYVVARLLAEAGWVVRVWALEHPQPGGDAARAMAEYPIASLPFEDFHCRPGSLVIDALFGAGLSRHLPQSVVTAAADVKNAGADVLAIDLPSGVSGEDGDDLGGAFRASHTVTFARMKPGHLLYPGRALCGTVFVADIGIEDRHVAATGCRTWQNTPALWSDHLPRPPHDTHKYRRGHVLVLSGQRCQTGAARLSAAAAARSGAGAVTLGSPRDALDVNAAHLTSTMLSEMEQVDDLRSFLVERKPAAGVIGPAFGVGERTRDFTAAVLHHTTPMTLILDADALTSFERHPDDLFNLIGETPSAVIMTPHEGEFRRLFPDISDRSKLMRARIAARRAGAVIVYKGPDTIIAAPDGRAAINANGTQWLATAGAGDVLAGIIAGLAGQGMEPFEAACAGVWMHAEAGCTFGPGLIADDLPGLLPSVLRGLYDETRR